MSEIRQRVEPIRSRKLLDSARGQECTFHFPGICNHDRETTVSAHLTDDQFGMAQKADDFSTVFACSACHDFHDRRLYLGTDIEPDIDAFRLRAWQRTQRNRIDRGLIVIPVDPVQSFHGRVIRPRKPKAERKPSRFAGSRDSRLKRKMDGTVVDRITGERM